MADYIEKHWCGDYEGMSRRERMGGSYAMYQPDTLSDRSFLLYGETAADISDAERAVSEINERAKVLPSSEGITRLALRAEALSSSRIEGLVVGPRRILKAEAIGSSDDATAQEVLNNVNSMNEAIVHACDREITIDSLCEIHAVLLRDTQLDRYADLIRAEQNWLGELL